MKFSPLSIPGVFIMEQEPIVDERGAFARVFCRQEFRKMGLNPHLEQCSISYNTKCGTVRGMHFQKKPHAEAKIVRCIRGHIHDIILDLRSDSPMYKQWLSVDLSAANQRQLYIPEGIAHGFQTLEDNTEVFYQITRTHAPDFAAGVRWDDPSFGISWPIPISVISKKDQNYVDFV